MVLEDQLVSVVVLHSSAGPTICLRHVFHHDLLGNAGVPPVVLYYHAWSWLYTSV